MSSANSLFSFLAQGVVNFLAVENEWQKEYHDGFFRHNDFSAVLKSRLKKVYRMGLMIEVAYLTRPNTWDGM